MKHDLVRLKDKYGRADIGYEGKEKMQLINGSYVKFKSEEIRVIKNFCNNYLCLSFIQNDNDLKILLSQKPKLAVILNGFIKSANDNILYRLGDVIKTNTLKNNKIKFNNVSLLSVSKA